MAGALTGVDAIVARAEERFQTHRQRVFEQTDRVFTKLMLGQWAAAVVVAVLLSPYAWEGKQQVVHAHIYVAVFLGGLLSSLPIALTVLKPGWVLTRHVVAVAQMLWSALFVHLTGGRIETHFHVFGSLAFLAFYRDWKVLLTATVAVAAEHFLRGLMWPEAVYGVTNPEWWRFLEHAFWVVFCVSFLISSCLSSVREMRHISEREAQFEALQGVATA